MLYHQAILIVLLSLFVDEISSKVVRDVLFPRVKISTLIWGSAARWASSAVVVEPIKRPSFRKVAMRDYIL